MPKSKSLYRSIYYYLFRTKLYLQSSSTTHAALWTCDCGSITDQLGQIPLLVPPVEEQSAIVAYYAEATVELDRTDFER